MDILAYNRAKWNKMVDDANRWTLPVDSDEVARARDGDFTVLLTPTLPVPKDWLGELSGRDLLGLACGGGQQGPLLAAAGANVTIFDNSPGQLSRDREVAERDGLSIATVQGDMRDLSAFDSETFDMIFHPVSNCFVDDVNPVWREAYRVLRPGGELLSGVTNPVLYCFEEDAYDKGELLWRFKIPYSDIDSLDGEERQRCLDNDNPLCWGHTLDDQIAGQLRAGFVLTGFYEDVEESNPEDLLIGEYLPVFFATRALKLAR